MIVNGRYKKTYSSSVRAIPCGCWVRRLLPEAKRPFALVSMATPSLSKVSWFIEGDIKSFFDSVDHEVLLKIIERNIKDGRLSSLLKRLLEAGYKEDWKWHRTYSGTPQGGIISPLVANIYLNEFDQWVENELMPLYNRKAIGKTGRKRNPRYRHYEYLRNKAKKGYDLCVMHSQDKQTNGRRSVNDVMAHNIHQLTEVEWVISTSLLFGFP